MYDYYGPQYWWPGDSTLEIMVGAILTQNTSWKNVESVIHNLKCADVLNMKKLNAMEIGKLKKLVKSAGFYNVKAERVKTFVRFMWKWYDGNIERMKLEETSFLRKRLLGIKGIGPETCDSILLYALEKPVFVVDAYTRRIFSRHKLINEKDNYRDIQSLFERNIRKNVGIYNEYHALIVKLAKDKCRPSIPDCESCPIEPLF